MHAEPPAITPAQLYDAYLEKIAEIVPGTVLTPIQKALLEELCETAIDCVYEVTPTMDVYLLGLARAFEAGQAMLLERIVEAFKESDAARITISYRDQNFTFNRSILDADA